MPAMQESEVHGARRPKAAMVRGEAARPAMGILLTRRAHAEERDASGRER